MDTRDFAHTHPTPRFGLRARPCPNACVRARARLLLDFAHHTTAQPLQASDLRLICGVLIP
jgi:hypothetical protein